MQDVYTPVACIANLRLTVSLVPSQDTFVWICYRFRSTYISSRTSLNAVYKQQNCWNLQQQYNKRDKFLNSIDEEGNLWGIFFSKSRQF